MLLKHISQKPLYTTRNLHNRGIESSPVWHWCTWEVLLAEAREGCHAAVAELQLTSKCHQQQRALPQPGLGLWLPPARLNGWSANSSGTFRDACWDRAERAPLQGPLPLVSTWSRSPQAPWVHSLGVTSEGSTLSSLEHRQG